MRGLASAVEFKSEIDVSACCDFLFFIFYFLFFWRDSHSGFKLILQFSDSLSSLLCVMAAQE